MNKTKSLESLTRRDERRWRSEFGDEPDLSPAMLEIIEDTKAEIRRAFKGEKKVQVRRK